MFKKMFVEKRKTHILCSVTGKWKNKVEPHRPQMAIGRMRIACWTTKATNTHSEYEIFTAFPLQQ